MLDTAMQIKRHIEVLENFEQRYGEFLVARRNKAEIPEVQWPNKEWAERERELRMLAPRADAAMEASGEGSWPDFSGTILAFTDWTGFASDATEDKLQWEILSQIPSQIGGLHMRLEEAEEAKRKKGRRLLSAVSRHRPRWGWLRDPNPWLLYIGGGVVTLVIGTWIGTQIFNG
jgi:hypothetical protein